MFLSPTDHAGAPGLPTILKIQAAKALREEWTATVKAKKIFREYAPRILGWS